jgi:hypothetical protein
VIILSLDGMLVLQLYSLFDYATASIRASITSIVSTRLTTNWKNNGKTKKEKVRRFEKIQIPCEVNQVQYTFYIRASSI